MITEEDVYIAYRKASGKPYRRPKDFAAFLCKMKENERKCLQDATLYFNTKWHNIDLDLYMECGWGIFTYFHYSKFFDQRIIKLYITKDKIRKSFEAQSKEKIIESAKFVIRFMKENELTSLYEYGRKYDQNIPVAISHHINNKIDAVFLYYLLLKKYLLVDNLAIYKIEWTLSQMHEYQSQTIEFLKFMKRVEESINVQATKKETK